VIEPIFVCQDDKIFDLPADVNLRTKGQFLHPDLTMDDNPLNPDGTAATPANEGAYSWLMTVVPAAGELAVSLSSTTNFQVSVAVCYRRNYNTDPAQGVLGEQVATATFLGGVGIGGGSVQLTDPSGNPAYVSVKENQWVLLLGTRQCKWYRVVATGGNPTSSLTLSGPDWDIDIAAPTATIVIIDSVIGVYSTTIELDRDSLWSQ
jgi:hypothetical protein